MKRFAAIASLFFACTVVRGEGEAIEAEGQVMFVADSSPRRLHVITDTNPGGFSFWDASGRECGYSSGDIVKVRGFRGEPSASIKRETSDASVMYATNVTVLSSARFPETAPATLREIAGVKRRNMFVHLEGTVVSVVKDATNSAWNWLIVQTETGEVAAAATEHDYPCAALRTLIDAEVRIKGIAQMFHTWRKFMGGHVILFGRDGIETAKPAGDPFDAPGIEAATSHRRKVSGVVAGLDRRRIYIRSEAGRFIPVSVSSAGERPAAGDGVTVSGFVKSGPLGLQMTEAAVRRDGRRKAALEPAEEVDARRLLAACRDNDIADASLYGKPVRLRGRISNSTEDIAISGRVMLECDGKNVTVDVAHLPQSVRDTLETGSVLEAAGLCIPEFDADVTNMVFPEFKGLVVIPRAAEDMRVLRTPPWWTPARFCAVILALVLVIIAILVWNRMLKVLSERRGKALYEEQISSAMSELRVEERTRLAVELHDSISQVLTGIALQVDAAIGSGIDGASRAGRFLATARSMLASCRQELRCCIWDLRTRAFEEQDMQEAVRQTLAPHVGGIPLLVRFSVPRSILSEPMAHDMLRIMRELATNAVRHGNASRIKVFGECRGNLVRFCVKDDGCGFDPGAAPGPAEGHFGLQGVRERIKKMGGELEIESAAGKGTSITAAIPLSPSP